MKRFVSDANADPGLLPQQLWSADPDTRVALAEVETMLLGALEHFRDHRLGLALGRRMRFGEGGAFDYAVQSAATVRDSLDVAGDHCKLICDSLQIWQEMQGSRVIVRILDEASWTAPGADFSMCAFYKLHLSNALPPGAKLECWFPYAEPADVSDHLDNFRGAGLRFNAPFFGFAFDQAYHDMPMPGADPALHPVHCHRVRSMIEEISRRHVTSLRVRRVILEQLRETKDAPGDRVAAALGMSRRTLSRRLEQEGTSFIEQLDRARREIALVYVGQTETALTEVAFSLGLSHVESFHRAFKRWTGETPLAYRTRRRAG
jgi:AraC-like DNA-binding protein